MVVSTKLNFLTLLKQTLAGTWNGKRDQIQSLLQYNYVP